jgi:twitching motility protein PilT
VSKRIDEYLRAMIDAGASDLHVKAGQPPSFRIDGRITPQVQFGALDPETVRSIALEMMTQEQRETFEDDGDLDFSHQIPGLARFRVNALTQRSSVGLVIRQIPVDIPSADQLGLPQICKDLALKPRGLVLVTGPTGSGKSTTLAAMIDYVNENEHGHILTMEDPLEFLHRDKNCLVTQRQVGSDTKTFNQALRRALRQDPDVILIGEMRDLETISMAITAAETGHLVFGTLHTTSAISTVDRIIDVFPPDQQTQVRVQLASTIQGVISQCLVKKVGGGRCAVQEILVGTDGVKSLIREGKTAQMLNLLQTGSRYGMTTLENELVRLARAKQITPEDAVSKANRPDDVRKQLGLPAAGEGDAAGGAGGGRTPMGTAGGADKPAGARPRAPESTPSEPAAGGDARRAPAAEVRGVKGRGGLFGRR